MKRLLLVVLLALAAFAQFQPPAGGGSGGGVSGLTTNKVPKASSSTSLADSSITDDGATITTTEDLAVKSITTGDGTKTGIDIFQGVTSGTVGLTAYDIAGTAINYVLPSTNGAAGQVMYDIGAVTCPTLPATAPATCHGLAFGYPNTGNPFSTTPGPTYSVSSQSGAIGSTNLIATSPATNTIWKLWALMDCTTAVASATATLTVTYTDPGGGGTSFSSATGTMTCTTIQSGGSPSRVQLNGNILNIKASTAVTFAVTVVNTPVYDLNIWMERMK